MLLCEGNFPAKLKNLVEADHATNAPFPMPRSGSVQQAAWSGRGMARPVCGSTASAPRHSGRTLGGGARMSKHLDTGRNPSEKELQEAERVLSLTPVQQRGHPSAVPADHSKLSHINTYGSLPEFYLDQPFTCRKCGKREIWKAKDQKW